MKNVVAENYRDIDFSRAKRSAIVKLEPGKTKISIRLDNLVLEYFSEPRRGSGGWKLRPCGTHPSLSSRPGPITLLEV
jgi:hypothetical protein